MVDEYLESGFKPRTAVTKDLIRNRIKTKRRLDIKPYLYILPSFIIFITFTFYPFIKTLFLSLNLTNRRGQAVEFVGFENYINLLSSPEFWNSVLLTFKLALFLLVPVMLISLFLALLANERRKNGRVYELLFSMPCAIASAPASLIWLMISHPTNGILNHLIHKEIGWLSDPSYALITVAAVTVWLGIGMSFIFLYAGLKSLPEELMESATIDGASYFRKLRSIILPMLSPQLFFVFFMNTVAAFQAFAQIRLLTQGGPGDSTNVLVNSLYQDAFINSRFDLASAKSLALFIIVLLITLLQFSFEKDKVYYND